MTLTNSPFAGTGFFLFMVQYFYGFNDGAAAGYG